MESRREQRKREVRERIMESAMRRFIRQGFEDTTVDQIAADADVAQKTFFNYFPTKQDLFRQLAEARIDEFVEILDEERQREAPTGEKLAHCFVRLSELLEERKRFARDLILEVMRARPPGTNVEELSRLHGCFGEILREGRVAGDVRDDESVEFLAEMVVGVFTGVMNNWVTLPGYPMKDRLAQTAAFLGDAIAPMAGRRR